MEEVKLLEKGIYQFTGQNAFEKNERIQALVDDGYVKNYITMDDLDYLTGNSFIAEKVLHILVPDKVEQKVIKDFDFGKLNCFLIVLTHEKIKNETLTEIEFEPPNARSTVYYFKFKSQLAQNQLYDLFYHFHGNFYMMLDYVEKIKLLAQELNQPESALYDLIPKVEMEEDIWQKNERLLKSSVDVFQEDLEAGNAFSLSSTLNNMIKVYYEKSNLPTWVKQNMWKLMDNYGYNPQKLVNLLASVTAVKNRDLFDLKTLILQEQGK